MLSSLSHPNVIRFYDEFVDDEMLHIVMEYAPNGSLATVLANHQRTQRPMAEDTIWRYALQLLLEGLREALELRGDEERRRRVSRVSVPLIFPLFQHTYAALGC